MSYKKIHIIYYVINVMYNILCHKWPIHICTGHLCIGQSDIICQIDQKHQKLVFTSHDIQLFSPGISRFKGRYRKSKPNLFEIISLVKRSEKVQLLWENPLKNIVKANIFPLQWPKKYYPPGRMKGKTERIRGKRWGWKIRVVWGVGVEKEVQLWVGTSGR